MLASLILLVAAAEPPDTVVVCPRDFVSALAPWVRHRESQGHRIEILPNTRSAGELRQAIRSLGQSGKLKYVMLVGDADPRAAHDSAIAQYCTPTYQAAAKINVRWGSEPEIGTDNWYADLDDDMIPELAIGRLTADSREELSVQVKKIIDYENNHDFGIWRRRINFVAGVGGFGAMADSILEMTTKKFLTEGIPSSYQTNMTYGSWRSPFCPDPRRFHETTMDRLNEGCLFWVYIGHGQRTYLDRIYVPGNAYHILGVADVRKVDHHGHPPIAIFLSCYAGAFDGPQDCLGEELLRSSQGPVAVLCGSRVTMPYAMAVLGNELMGNYFGTKCETLGDAVLATKQKMAAATSETTNDASNRQLLEALAKAISPAPDLLDEERREHLLLFNLLGDPLLRLNHPSPVKVEVPADCHAGERMKVQLASDITGECTVDLICRRDRMKQPGPVREYYDGRDRILSTYGDAYQQANDGTWCAQTVRCTAGQFQLELEVPPEAFGNCHVRAYVSGQTGYALGSTDVFVRKPRQRIAEKK